LDGLLNLLVCDAGLEKELGELKDAAQYVMDLYIPQEEGAEPKSLIDRLDEAEGRIKGLLLDTANLAATAAYRVSSTTTRRSTCRRSRKTWTCLVSSGARTWVRAVKL
jgi:hypothetical protein